MRFIFRWLMRFFGIFVFVRGAWFLWPLLQGYRLGVHRRGEGEATYLGSSLHDSYYMVEHVTLSSAFLLTVSGLIIIVLSFRR